MARIGLMDITERIERGGVTVRIKKVLSPTSFRPGADRSNRAISILSTVAGAYALVLPYAALIAMALFALSVIEAVWRRRLAPLVFVNTILFVTMATRLALLSYVDVTAFPAINTLYLSPIYPGLMFFCAFALIDGVRLATRFKSLRASRT